MKVLSSLAFGISVAVAATVIAAAPAPTTAFAQQIYGSQLMTAQERSAYRDRMRNARTAEERERIRNEHHKLMQERAKQRGVTLPDSPPATGMGQGSGMGPGGGMGGGGMRRGR